MGTRRSETPRHGGTGLTLLQRRAIIQRGGGVGALEASRETETGKEASMAAPFPAPTAEQGAWVAIAEQGARADSGDHG